MASIELENVHDWYRWQ